ncbi:MAG TPA: hypothetical protein VGE74_24305 [Gemmata sp.]
MSLPPTVSEEQLLAAIAKVASVLSAKKLRLGIHDADDIGQIVAVLALEALPKYEPSKGGLEGFLFRHCSNRILNMRRDELGLRSDPPCKVCYQHALGGGEGHPDGSTCPVFARWWARRQRRTNLTHPHDLDRVAELEQESRAWTDSNVPDSAANAELLDLIDAHVPLDLRADYLRMRAGEQLPKVRRERVLQAARDILDDPCQYESQGPNTTFEGLELDDDDE